MPLTALTTLIISIAMIGAWLLVRHRIKNSGTPATRQVALLNLFLIQMGIFSLFMFVPYIWLALDRSQFPVYMAWGYVVGHIFMYIAFLNIGRIFFSIVPRLSGKTRAFEAIALTTIAITTVVNAVTMIWGVRPEFSDERGITLFNVHPFVGAVIVIFALVCVVPVGVLMIRNGFAAGSTNTRTRSLLIGSGLLVLMLGGPLHDISQTITGYMIADIVTICGQLLVAGGVAYRIEEHIRSARPAVRATAR